MFELFHGPGQAGGRARPGGGPHLNHNQIGTEHILLGLIHEREESRPPP